MSISTGTSTCWRHYINQKLFLVPKPNIRWRPKLDLSNLNKFLKAEKFKMETPETIRTSLQTQGVGNVHRLHGHLRPHTHSKAVQKIPSRPGSNLPVRSSAFWSVHSTHRVDSSGQRGQTDGITQGYKDPPVPVSSIHQP